ncbi:MAG: hypothetical protein LBT59_21310 [Clostridiales bacterium]|nr:hypothetical protein [Clostridiales bacterium]
MNTEIQKEDIFYTILQRYSNKSSTQSTSDFIKQELAESKLFEALDIDIIANAISNTIDANSKNYKEIQEYKKKGINIYKYLRDVIERNSQKFSSESKNSLIASIKNSLNASNSTLIKEFTQHEQSEVVDNLKNYDFVDLDKDIIAGNLENEIKVNTLISPIIMENIGDKI